MNIMRFDSSSGNVFSLRHQRETPAADKSGARAKRREPFVDSNGCPPFIEPHVWERAYYHSVARKVVIYLAENIGQPICLARISAVACMETTAFARAFRRTTGMTFMRFVQAYRIGVFVSRLESSDDPITVIAQECGFNSLVTLERAFKKLVGQTPSSYRNQFLASRLPLTGRAAADGIGSAKSRRQSANP